MHHPEFKGRKDLLPICNFMDDQGNCKASHYIFRRPPPSEPKQVAASATGAKPAHPDPDLTEIKTLLLGLLTEQSTQKALITAMLADDPDD